MISSYFYQSSDVVKIARSLLGKLLITRIDSQLTGGYITETEAYAGVSDRASHAYRGRRTKRTEVMFCKGGVAYVYLCYGMHHLLNVVTGDENLPHAVLIRQLHPIIGIEVMKLRRKKNLLTNGPGTLSQALGITHKLNGVSFRSHLIWIERGIEVKSIQVRPRIGIDYAGPDASLPYRFIAKLTNM